ncbi:hypothetical protein [Staphylococcus haemolyticus]|uniref:hypothetical protein n=1 Tax=Staphylococcus haemolyticus TaxID=1283 RepID=UPI001F0B07DA|nr:hypothetical protein [Staphylococcus haemolyticus]MCH4334925.1 hypothetical protein [Staphylococcus haemolyticus]
MNKSIKFILVLLLVFIAMVIVSPLFLKAVKDTVTDIDNHVPEKRIIKDTKEVKGTVISSEDKSYRVKEPTFLFIGGEEKEIEKYYIKIKEENGNIITVKANEQQYLSNNKNNSIKVVIDKNTNEIMYDMNKEKDKKTYEEYKKMANSN